MTKKNDIRITWYSSATSGVRGGGSAAPPGLKKSRQTLFSGQAQVAQKSWKIFKYRKIIRANSVFQGKRNLFKILNNKKYIFNTVNAGQTLFFRASASSSKFLKVKKCIVNTVNSGHTLFFRASASCSKILNVKSISNAVKNFRANSVFQGKRKVAQNSWMVKNIFNTVKHFRANSVFQGKRKLLKNPERWKYFQYSVFSVYSLGVIGVCWASVVCNLDQSRDWL